MRWMYVRGCVCDEVDGSVTRICVKRWMDVLRGYVHARVCMM